MARLSASISDETKDELYALAEQRGEPVSHLVQAALDAYLGKAQSATGEHQALHAQLEELTRLVQELHQRMRAPGRSGGMPRFF